MLVDKKSGESEVLETEKLVKVYDLAVKKANGAGLIFSDRIYQQPQVYQEHICYESEHQPRLFASGGKGYPIPMFSDTDLDHLGYLTAEYEWATECYRNWRTHRRLWNV